MASVATTHSLMPRTTRALARRLFLPRVPSSTILTAVSSVAADSLQGLLPRRDVAVLPNGIEPRDWQPPVGRAPGTPLTLVSTMRTARRKRPLALLRVLEEVRRAVPQQIGLRAVLVGSGPLDRAVRRRLRDPGLRGWVVQAGQLERPEISRLLAVSDVYLAPATLESFGIAALEARCAGLPVVGMRQSGLRDFIEDGTEGYLVDGDQQLAAVTAWLLTHPEERAAMRSHNLRNRPTADWSVVLGMHRELYARASRAVGATSAHVARVPEGEAAGLRPHQQTVRTGTDRDAELEPTRPGREDVHGRAVASRQP